MGIETTVLPDNVLRRMSPADRRVMGKAGLTAEEAREKAMARSERELQNTIANYLRLHGIWFDQDSMAHKRRGTKGAPDFLVCYRGRFLAWECKIFGAGLKPDQVVARDEILRNGGEWRLIRSLQEVQAHLREVDSKLKDEGGI